MRARFNDLLFSLQGTWISRVVGCILFPAIFWPPFAITFINAIICERLCNATPRIGAYGYGKTVSEMVRELVTTRNFQQVIVAGDPSEQKTLARECHELELTMLDISNGTYGQAKKIVGYASQHRLPAIFFITHESLYARAYLSLLKSAGDFGLDIPIIGEVYLEPARTNLTELEISANEALSLRRYQRRGHVAGYQQLFRHLQRHGNPQASCDTLFIIL